MKFKSEDFWGVKEEKTKTEEKIWYLKAREGIWYPVGVFDTEYEGDTTEVEEDLTRAGWLTKWDNKNPFGFTLYAMKTKNSKELDW